MRIPAALAIAFALVLSAGCSDDDNTTAPVSLDMGEAIEVVTDDLLPDLVSPGDEYYCIRMDGSLSAGTVIEEDAPSGWAAPSRTAPASAALAEESYFFLLDLAPATFYEHPVKYIVVGKSGKTTVTDASWWPKIGGSTYPQFMKTVPDQDHVIAGNFTFAQPSGTVFDFVFPSLAVQFGDGFIPVQGLMPEEKLFDEAQANYLNLLDFCNAYRDASFNVLVNGLVQGDADGVLNAIDGMVDSGKSPVTLLILCHGGVDGLRLGGAWITAAQFSAKMASHPTVDFNFLLGSCHSGSFQDDMQALANVQTFHAACAPAGGSTPDWDYADGVTDYNIADTGSEWFSSVLQAGNTILTNSSYWTSIQIMARDEGTQVSSMLLHMMCFGGLGTLPGWGMEQNLDLSNRTGHTVPQGFAKWY